MKRSMLALMLLALTLTGCREAYRDTTLYQRNGRAKPIVAFLPVIDHSDQKCTQEGTLKGVTFNVSQEMTQVLRNRLSTSPKLYLLKDRGSLEIAEEMNDFDIDHLSKASTDGLSAAEFIVVTELLEQQEKPYTENLRKPVYEVGGHVSHVLALSFRVRVLDMRDEKPKVILQEVVHSNHMIPMHNTHFDYSKISYGTEKFYRTPLGIAHQRLIREVSSRIENYIRANKG